MARFYSDSEIEKLLELNDEELDKFIGIPDGDESEIGDESDTNDMDEVDNIRREAESFVNVELLIQNVTEERVSEPEVRFLHYYN